MINKILDNIKTLMIALIIAILIRSLLFQPFYIPSSSMEPTLLVGDRIFVSKYTYGYSKHSFPFSPPIFNKRIFSSDPNYGDLVVFKTPSDNRTDFIKRLIGLPGDKIQFLNGELFINNKKILREELEDIAFSQLNPSAKKSLSKRIEFLREEDGKLLKNIVRNALYGIVNIYICKIYVQR